MKNLSKYRVFGLTIESEVEFPELPRDLNQEPTVSIKYGFVPLHLSRPLRCGILFESTENDFILHFENIGAFRVQEGQRITVQPNPKANPEEIRLFLLGSIMGALFHQKGVLALHGSAVKIGNKAFVFVGYSSVGKSSLVASLCDQGIPVLTDDISVLTQSDGEIFVNPGIPNLKLWKDVISHLKYESNLQKVRPNVEKFFKPINRCFANEPTRLESIIVLNKKNSIGFSKLELKGVKKFEALYSQTYRRQYLAGPRQISSHFKALTQLANSYRAYKIERPSAPLLLLEFSDFIKEEVLNTI